MTLRRRIAALAHERPDLRELLVPLLKEAATYSDSGRSWHSFDYVRHQSDRMWDRGNRDGYDGKAPDMAKLGDRDYVAGYINGLVNNRGEAAEGYDVPTPASRQQIQAVLNAADQFGIKDHKQDLRLASARRKRAAMPDLAVS